MTVVESTKDLKTEKLKIAAAITGLAAVLILIVTAAYAWYSRTKSINTVTEIHTPTVLVIGAGNKEDIQQLNLGDIDVTEGTYKDFVFCVYSDLSEDYVLQLAHTTNIKFEYTIYKAGEISAADAAGHLSETSSVLTSGTESEYRNFLRIVPFIGMTGDYYYDRGERLNGHFLNRDPADGFLANKKILSYESYDAFQKNANPLYWQSETVKYDFINNTGEDLGFCDYYILTLSWKPGEVKNDKETDIVYLTASLK